MLSREKLIKDVSKDTELDPKVVATVLQSYDKHIQKGVLNGEIVYLGMLGKLRLKKLASGSKVRISATPYFRKEIQNATLSQRKGED
ncbi:HU family DNA-binding protein [Ligilactobacillus salivarius]|uniref:HU family DNA-binding protein n=1 Tax=Ligilactobacillus salivarius TaxID=1624 RepID=UPI0018799752|nr:HU family DNA-binding protein [Ligilactobacillus salivarius]